MEAFAKSDIGKAREMNQDYYYISPSESKINLYIEETFHPLLDGEYVLERW